MSDRKLRTELLIVGGGLGGVAATLAALRLGRDVVLVEELDWLGGQLTVPGRAVRRASLDRERRRLAQLPRPAPAIRAYYLRHYPVTAEARARVPFNPGMGNVGTLCHEPRVARARHRRSVGALRERRPASGAAPPCRGLGRHRWRPDRGHRRAQPRDRTIPSRSRRRSSIDATETGDLLEAAGIEHVIGAESAAETGELHALAEADPLDQQAITWCFAHRPPAGARTTRSTGRRAMPSSATSSSTSGRTASSTGRSATT